MSRRAMRRRRRPGLRSAGFAARRETHIGTILIMTLADRCRAIEFLVVGVDGVLTDGGIEYGTATTGLMELKRFHVRDGFALRTWERSGKRTGLITGRDSPIV